MAVFYFHFMLCIAVTAILWFMQVVHYPLFAFVDKTRWSEFTERKRRQTMMILYPLMAFEALTGITLILMASQSATYIFLALEVGLLAVLHIYNFMYFNALVKKITGPEDSLNHQRCVKMHWIRTAGWSLRLVLLIFIILGSV